ncbi:MAG: hypothetical protein L6R37_005914 [Teloschistes peruensis]|nr:MAG: hypothetical protein L6R37_005914 [Teloschistes peruensis]
MPSPFPPSSSAPGKGHVHLTLRSPNNEPVFTALSYSYPLKLVVSAPHTLPPNPTSPSSTSTSTSEASTEPSLTENDTLKSTIRPPSCPSKVPLLFLLTYGGGLVSGDYISLSLHLAHSTRLTIATQGSTKIFRPPTPSSSSSTALTTRQDLTATIAANAALCLMPDPCQPFARSRYAQKQVFEMDAEGGGASLCLLDWVCEGRGARGEKWAFEGWRGRNEVWDVPAACCAEDAPSSSSEVAGEGGEEQQQQQQQHQSKRTTRKKKLLLRDNLILSHPNLHTRVDTHAIFGTLILVGPLLSPLSNFFIDEFSQMPRLGARDFTSPLHNPKANTTSLNPNTNPTTTTAPPPTPSQKRDQWRATRHLHEQNDGILWTATTTSQNLTIIKFAAPSVEAAKTWLRSIIKEEGSISHSFGAGALIPLK